MQVQHAIQKQQVEIQWLGMTISHSQDDHLAYLQIPALVHKWRQYIADFCSLEQFHSTALKEGTFHRGLLQRSRGDFGVSLTIHRIAGQWVMVEAGDEYLTISLYCESLAHWYRGGPGFGEDVRLGQVNPDLFTDEDLRALLWLGHRIRFTVVAEWHI